MKRKVGWYFLFVVAIWSLAGTVMARDWVYTTRPGDNLWNISKTHLKSVTYWKKLKEYNGVNLPQRLSPGIRLKIPVAWLKYPPEPVNVIFVSGAVNVLREGAEPVVLKTGDELFIGDTIQSQEGSASLRFADGSTVLIQSESELILDSLSAYKRTGMVDTQLRLQRGRIETNVVPLEKSGSRYEIITPAAVAAVRGTRYRVNADAKDNLMRAEVLDGRVDVANEKASQNVAANFGTLTEAGKAPKPPRKLLSPPELMVPVKIRKMPAQISWKPLPGAKSYRVFVTADTEKEELVYDTALTHTAVTLSDIPDGAYRIKVRGIDELGLEGINAEANLTIDTRLGPPLIWPKVLSPTVNEDTIIFDWQPVESAEAYHIQIASDEAFTELVVDAHRSETRYELTAADNKAHHFRVRTASNLHEPGAFSQAVVAKQENRGIFYFLGSVLLIMAI